MRMYGLEAEYLLENATIAEVMKLGIKGVSAEFYAFMVELVSGVHNTPNGAVREVGGILSQLQRSGVRLHPYASWSHEEPWDKVRWSDVTGDSDYYKWVYYEACQTPMELHHVGMHLNISDDQMSGDEIVHAVNWLRCLGFLFGFISANSPLRNGRPAGCHTRRSYSYPNRYDVPLWSNEAEFKAWVAGQEALRRIYPGKARCWMTVCPRLEGDRLDGSIERMEVRCIDSGINMSLSVVEGCFQLANRIIDHAAGRPLPACMTNVEQNDKAVAWLGRSAIVRLEGRERNVLDVARRWCSGIESLEAVLDGETASEKVLAAL